MIKKKHLKKIKTNLIIDWVVEQKGSNGNSHHYSRKEINAITSKPSKTAVKVFIKEQKAAQKRHILDENSNDKSDW